MNQTITVTITGDRPDAVVRLTRLVADAVIGEPDVTTVVGPPRPVCDDVANVEVTLGDRVVGNVLVVGPDAEPIHLAAGAHRSLAHEASYLVAGETFTAAELEVWWA